MAPTRIYVKPLLALMKSITVKGMAHITGGGLLENVPRVLPENVVAQLDGKAWHTPALFDWLREMGNIAPQEMYRTFNCGIGMVVIVAKTRCGCGAESTQRRRRNRNRDRRNTRAQRQ